MEAASPASFQPLNAHTIAGARRPSGRRSQMKGCIRTTVHHGLMASAASCPPAGPPDGRHASQRGAGRRGVRVHAQGTPDLPLGYPIPDDRPARQHRSDPCARVPRRRRARRALSSGASWCGCADASSGFATSSRSRFARSRAPRACEADPARFLPVAYRDLDELEGFLEHLAREVYDPGLKALLARLLGDRRAARRDPPRTLLGAGGPPHGRPGAGAVGARLLAAITPTSAACWSTRSRSRRWRSSCASLHPRLDRDLLLSAAIVHDLGKTREFTYGAEIARSAEGRLLGHIELGLRVIAEHVPAALGERAQARARALRDAPPRRRGRRAASASARPRRSRCTG